MLNAKIKRELKPLATSGPYAKPFVVELGVNILDISHPKLVLSCINDDGTTTMLAEETFELPPEWVEKLKKLSS
jgi:hypothetical protein